MRRSFTRTGLILILGSLGLSCASSNQEPSAPEGYAREAPQEDQSIDFDRVMRSVQLISSTAFYRQADFWDSPGLPLDADRHPFWNEADSVSTFTETISGTATIIGFSNDRLVAVTARHVAVLPDTVRSYYYDELGRRDGISAIAVKTRHEIMLPNVGDARHLEVLASDERYDLILVGQAIPTEDRPDLTIPTPVGDGSELEWGTTAFVVGFPAGMSMVTSGIISQPERDHRHAFLLDIVFNKGMSGAPVFARRKNTATYEWVGIVTSGSAGSEFLMVPDAEQAQRSIETGEPFEGKLFASRIKRLRYGITMAVSSETVAQFLQDNKGWLYLEGYRLTLSEE